MSYIFKNDYFAGAMKLPLSIAGEGGSYRGCGRGWVDMDESGNIERMAYADSLDDKGQKEQNVSSFDRSSAEFKSMSKSKKFGNTWRVLCDFSCHEACLHAVPDGFALATPAEKNGTAA